MNTSPANMFGPPRSTLSRRIYQLLLLAYPAAFRREYGPQMAQLFYDCQREEWKRGNQFALARLWFRTLLDLIRTAPTEHWENLRKENSMNNPRRDAVALFGCIGIIVIAFLLLNYGRRHEVSTILTFGYTLDALVTAGAVGNLIVFLLAKTTRLNPLRTAVWTFLIVNAVPVILLAITVGRSDPHFKLGSVLVGYVASFLFWVGIHWLWSRSSNELPAQ